MNIWTKKLQVPASNETREIEVAQLWEVRWNSRTGTASWDVRPEVEAFPDEDAARQFALSLKNAYGLLRHTSGTIVTVEKAR